jgi:hypothetical protein
MADNGRRIAVLVGALWITATIAGLLSAVLLQPTLDAQDYLTRAALDQNRVATGLLLDLVMAVAIVAIAVVLYPILRRSSQRLALGFFAARTIEGVVYLIGIALSLLILVTISQEFVSANAPAAADLESLGSVFMGALDWVNYTVLVVVFSLSALVLNIALYQSRLVPRWLSIWGLVGATAYLLSGIAVMYGLEAFSTPQTLLMAPLAVQEMVLAVWLIVKGFNRDANTSEAT